MREDGNVQLSVNKNTVTHVKIYDFQETSYLWCEEKISKFLWVFDDGVFKQGYWKYGKQDRWGISGRLNPELLVNYIDIEGILHKKPRLEIYTEDCLIGVKYFNTVVGAENYTKTFLPNVDIRIN